jgi:hypothetical protein
MRRKLVWRCFFCNEVFRSRRSAWLHFGEQNCEDDIPACIDPLRHDEKERMKQVREIQEYAMQCQQEAQDAEDAEMLLETFRKELVKYFGEGCTSVWLAYDRYRSALNLIEALKEKCTPQS